MDESERFHTLFQSCYKDFLLIIRHVGGCGLFCFFPLETWNCNFCIFSCHVFASVTFNKAVNVINTSGALE